MMKNIPQTFQFICNKWVLPILIFILLMLSAGCIPQPVANSEGPEDNRLNEVQNPSGVLGKVETASFEELVAALKDGNQMVRAEAARELGNRKEARAVEPLMAALLDDSISYPAAMALGQIGEPAIEPLITALKDEKIMYIGSGGFGEIGEPAVEPLIIALLDEDKNVRMLAASALGKIKDPRAIQPLMALMGDEDVVVRRNTNTALGK